MDSLFVTDYVCPYCLVAKEALKQALEITGQQVNVRTQPYELTPEPKEQVDTWNDARRRAGYKILEEPCRKLTLPMKLPPHVIPRPYTRLAFEGFFFAAEQGRGEEYSDAVYRAYFLEEKDIGQIPVLAGLAEKVGLDANAFVHALEKGLYTEQEKQAVAYSREVLQPTGVPTLYIDGEKVMLNEYTKEEMVAILTKQAEKSAAPAMVCGDDGCAMQ
jgi:predicted DsbA family dithiol-disulfide isomerase